MRWFWLTWLILLIPSAGAAVYINEIMYDPSGSDTGKEWIELYNDGSCENINSQWRFFAAGDHLLNLYQGNSTFCAGQYIVIADSPTTFLSEYPLFNGTLFDSSFSLLNSNQTIAIKNTSTNILNNVTYFSQWGGNGDGKSLEYLFGSWIPSIADGGTPGLQNGQNTSLTNSSASSGGKGLKLTVNVDSPIYLNLTYTNLFKIENLDHVTGQQENHNAALQYNLTRNNVLVKQETISVTGINSYKTSDTGSFVVNETGMYILCGEILASSANDTNASDNTACSNLVALDPSTVPCNVSLGISVNQSIFQSGQTVKFEHIVNNETFPFTIRYWVEDIFGDIAKSVVESSNTNQKSWTPDVSGLEKAFLIKSELSFTACNDADKSDNHVEKLIVVKGEGITSSKNPNSSIAIVESDPEGLFGSAVDARISVYKGDAAAYAITASIKGRSRVSEETKFYAYSKFTNYSLRLPIYIYPNCDDDYQDGEYNLTVTGLGTSASTKIRLSGNSSLCSGSPTSISLMTSALNSGKFAYSFLAYPQKAFVGDTINSQVKIDGDDETHQLEIYSYLRRGSKIYGEKGDNLQKIILPKEGSVVVQLSNLVSATQADSYDYVVKLRKDDQKTEKELKTTIEIALPSKLSSFQADDLDSIRNPAYKSVKDDPFWWQNRVDESVHVFESPTYKSRKLIAFGVIGLLGLLSGLLILKKISL